MTYSLKTQIYVFLLLLFPVFGQAATSINDIDKRTLCLTSNVKNEKICFSKDDVIKVRTKEKRFKGKITEIGDSTFTLTRKGENQIININELTEVYYFDKQDFWECFLVFMAASVYVVGYYLILLIAVIASFFILLLFTDVSKYNFLGKWWFISLVGVVSGVLGSIIFASAFKKNPFKRFKIGKSWKADIELLE